MCNWLKSLFGKKCHCEGGCCENKKEASEATPKTEEKEAIIPKEEVQA